MKEEIKLCLIALILVSFTGGFVIGLGVGEGEFPFSETESNKVGSLLLLHEYNETSREFKQTGIFTFYSGWAVRSKTWNNNYEHYSGDIVIRMTPQPYQHAHKPGNIINATINNRRELGWISNLSENDYIEPCIDFPDNRVEFCINQETGDWTHWTEDRFEFTLTYENNPFSYVDLNITLFVIDYNDNGYPYRWDNDCFDIQSLDLEETKILRELKNNPVV